MSSSGFEEVDTALSSEANCLTAETRGVKPVSVVASGFRQRLDHLKTLAPIARNRLLQGVIDLLKEGGNFRRHLKGIGSGV